MTLNDFDKDTIEEYILLIHNLFVHPDFIGKGVGTQLVTNAIEKMGKPVRLKCVSENHKALMFYEKSGWKKVVEKETLGRSIGF